MQIKSETVGMTRTTYYADYSAEVGRGAALLDILAPGWEHRVDLPHLNLASSQQCMLGQMVMEKTVLREVAATAYYAPLFDGRKVEMHYTHANGAINRIHNHLRGINHRPDALKPLNREQIDELHDLFTREPYGAERYGFLVNYPISLQADEKLYAKLLKHLGLDTLREDGAEGTGVVNWLYEQLTFAWIQEAERRRTPVPTPVPVHQQTEQTERVVDEARL